MANSWNRIRIRRGRPWMLAPVFLAAALAGCSGGSNGTSGPAPIPAPPDVAAVPADAQRTSDNLASKVLQAGTGARHPRANSEVTVHYTGWSTDGKMFDSSVARGEPATFRLDRVIPGWTEGVQMMVEGEKRRFWIPAKLAYEGADGPQGVLVFDIELIRILS
jgi:peptidylprolyl isomerase